MPSLINKNKKRRYLAAIMVNKKRHTKLFPDASRKSLKDALQWEDSKREELNRTGGQVTVQIWSDKYLAFAEVRFLKKTYNAKKAAFKRLINYLDGNKPVSNITEKHCLDYLTLQASKRTGNAANRDRKEFGTAYEFGRLYLGFKPVNPWRLVDKFPENKYVRYIPPMSDFKKVLAVAKGQDVAMLISLLHLAARKSELFGMQRNDVDYENKRIRLFTRKRKGGNREQDWLPATNKLLETLKSWEIERDKMKLPGKSPDRDYVFISLVTGRRFQGRDDFLKRLCDMAGVQRFSFHSIRHLTAMTLYRAGATTQHIQLVLRHLDPRTTSKYLRSIGIEEVRGTLEDTL